MATQFSGGTYISTSQISATKWSLMQFLMQQLATAGTNAGWTNLALGIGLGKGNQATCTITIASPGVVTMTGHGFLGGEQIMFATTGALPTGLSINTVYFVKYVDANTFNVAATLGGANINTSGSQSGVQTCYTKFVLLQSATQANVTNPIVCKMQDNAATSVSFSIQSSDGTIVGTNDTSNGGGLLPAAAQNFQLLASRYRFECFYPGAQSAGRQFVAVGMPYVPSNLTSVTNVGYMLGGSTSDGDTTSRATFRVAMPLHTNTPNVQCIWNTNLLQSSTNGNGFPNLVLPFVADTALSGEVLCRYANDQLNSGDPLIGWGLTSQTDEGKIKGQLFDTVYIAEAFAVDSTDTFNSHNWWNLTSNNTGTPRGGLWVATS